MYVCVKTLFNFFKPLTFCFLYIEPLPEPEQGSSDPYMHRATQTLVCQLLSEEWIWRLSRKQQLKLYHLTSQLIPLYTHIRQYMVKADILKGSDMTFVLTPHYNNTHTTKMAF